MLMKALKDNIDKFESKIKAAKNSSAELIINIKIDFKDNILDSYHSFLNESRLSALAISIYFASIKKLYNLLEQKYMKILVLDDLLISFDICNRLKLLDILKRDFEDFQIFFFTHDRELYEIYKNKLDWVKYELYLDDSEDIPKCIIKNGDSYLEKAIEFYGDRNKKDYECSAFFLRKELEKIFEVNLPYKMQVNEEGNKINLAGLLSKAIKVSSGEIKNILERLDRDRKHILNPLSHYDNRNISSLELKNTIEDLGKLREWQPNIKLVLPKYANLKFSFEHPQNTINNYILNLNDDLWLYEKDGKIDITSCKCRTFSCYEEKNGEKGELKEFTKTYESLYELYKSIFNYKTISLEADYYKFFEYKNKEGKWEKLVNLIKFSEEHHKNF